MLEDIFNAKSVAVIGASKTKGKIGNDLMNSLLGYYKGDIVPVNPKGGEILGIQAYNSMKDYGSVDLAVIAVPAPIVPSIVQECAETGIKNIIIISSGFKEINNEGALLEEEIIRICKKYDITLVGPNCLGIMDTYNHLNASFASEMANQGLIGFMSQSGAIMAIILDYADEHNIGFSRMVSFGNKAGINENDCLKNYMSDTNTRVITAYLEGIIDGPSFMKTCRETSKHKPIILIKSGTTSKGSEAVYSHTGTIAGADAAYDAAFRQSGIIRAASLWEMMNYSTALTVYPLPQGNRIAIITNSGGVGIMTTDTLLDNCLELATLTSNTIEKLKEGLPVAASVKNPIDVIGDATSERFRFTLDTVLGDPNVDAVIYLVTPQSVTDLRECAIVAAEYTRESIKPILSLFMGGTRCREASKVFDDANIPNYSSPYAVVKTIKALYDYTIIKNQEYPEPSNYNVNKEVVHEIIENSRGKNIHALGLESLRILNAYGIPTVNAVLTKSLAETLESADEIGYPLVMKIVSSQISHKSDVGGVKLNLNSKEEVREAYQDMMENIPLEEPEAQLGGVQLQKMLTGGTEVIIGMTRDPTFGPMLMFGLGGKYVEVLKDVAFSIAPVTEVEAGNMIKGIKTHELLEGLRGDKPRDLEAVKDIILRISQLVMDFPEINEFEINPLIVFPEGEGAYAVDMRLKLLF